MICVRYKQNPILSPEDIKPSRENYEVIGVSNCGVIKVDDEIILLLRVAERPINNSHNKYIVPIFDFEKGHMIELKIDKNNSEYDFSDCRRVVNGNHFYLTSISHLRVARSKNYVDFVVSDEIAIEPYDYYTSFGVEDPRITQIDDTYYITYAGPFDSGIVPCLSVTKDFINFEHKGAMFPPDNKDVLLFPEKINGKYYALHRPTTSFAVTYNMWISSSLDLKHWGDHKLVAKSRPESWDSFRIGASAVPIKTEKGWLNIYHGANKDNYYCLGTMLHDLDDPSKIIARSDDPILEPVAIYEKEGFFNNVVFSCGALEVDDEVFIYYGAADCKIALVKVKTEDLFSSLSSL